MKTYFFGEFGIDNLRQLESPDPACGPGQVVVDVRALSLNYRDILIITGKYNPNMKRPHTPISDAAGIVVEVGAGVTHVKPGDHVVIHGVPGWLDGPFVYESHKRVTSFSLPGLAAERVVQPAEVVLPIPAGLDFAQAATLPTAGLTAYNALFTDGGLLPGQTVLTLGTGGVSVFVVQMAKAAGAGVIITSRSEKKLARAKALGADHVINYASEPAWEKTVVELTNGLGADLTIETAGATLTQSAKATRAGGTICLLGSIGGTHPEVEIRFLFMKRQTLRGIYVGSCAHFRAMNEWLKAHPIEPVIDRVFSFNELPQALHYLESAGHFGKVVVTR